MFHFYLDDTAAPLQPSIYTMPNPSLRRSLPSKSNSIPRVSSPLATTGTSYTSSSLSTDEEADSQDDSEDDSEEESSSSDDDELDDEDDDDDVLDGYLQAAKRNARLRESADQGAGGDPAGLEDIKLQDMAG